MAKQSFAFDYSGRTLRSILVDDYLVRTADWMLTGGSRLHALMGNSHWEAALEIEFLVGLLKHLGNDDKLAVRVKTAVSEGLTWLISERTTTADNICHWDGVTWDTAVVLRCILDALHMNIAIPGATRESIEQLTVHAFSWLLKRFIQWPKEVKYPFGDADIAQILTTGVAIQTMNPEVMKRAHSFLRKMLPDDTLEDPLGRLCEFLTSRRTQLDEHPNTCIWEDFFQTAEVLESLTEYYNVLSASRSTDQEKLTELRGCIFCTIHSFEIGQCRGMWGTHADTCRALYSYLKCSQQMGVEPQDHIVFKALRWVCDEKQVFEDGSFLHTSFITTFFALAVLQACENWTLSGKSILAIYDDVVWHMEASSSTERGLRLEIENKKRALEAAVSQIRVQLQNSRRIIASLCVTGGLAVAAILSSSLGRAKVGDVGFLAIFVTGFLSLIVAIWTIGREAG